uniref:DUF3068 domain-containing protein n=1 Tax=Pseudonocardia lacus TaxID=2835865 RepID=UPI0020294B07
MQRRSIGLALLGIGAFCAVAAVAVRLFLVPQLVVLPLDQDGSSVATGTGVTVFYPGDLEQRSGVSVRAGRDVIGDPRAPDAGPDVAVWTASLLITDSEGALIGVTEDRVCLDRHTAQAVQPCASERLNGDNRVSHSGLSYTFPFGVEQRDYEMFDTTAQRPFPARFVGEEQIEGTTVYKFEQEVPETVTERREVPAQLAGGVEGTGDVAVERIYTNVRTVWVEPTSGVIVNGQEQQRQFFRTPDGTEGVTLIEGTLRFDDETVAAGLARALDASNRITLITTTLPIGLGVVGLLALVGGALLVGSAQRGAAPARGRHA